MKVWWCCLGAMGAGGALGTYLARRMNITDLPQMVAGFHSLVGLAAVATSVSSYMAHGATDPVALTATFLGALIGTITMTGAVQLTACTHARTHARDPDAGPTYLGNTWARTAKSALCKARTHACTHARTHAHPPTTVLLGNCITTPVTGSLPHGSCNGELTNVMTIHDRGKAQVTSCDPVT